MNSNRWLFYLLLLSGIKLSLAKVFHNCLFFSINSIQSFFLRSWWMKWVWLSCPFIPQLKLWEFRVVGYGLLAQLNSHFISFNSSFSSLSLINWIGSVWLGGLIGIAEHSAPNPPFRNTKKLVFFDGGSKQGAQPNEKKNKLNSWNQSMKRKL